MDQTWETKLRCEEDNKEVEMNEKLFWKKMSKMDGVKVRNCTRIKDRNGWLVLGEDKVQRTWMDYFGDLYNIDTLEQVAVHTYGSGGVQRGNYFGGLKWR